MNWNLARKVISDKWKGTSVFVGGILAYALMICAIFPSFEKMSGMQELFSKAYPEALYKFFGVQKIDLTSFNNYVVLEYLGVMWVIILGAFVIFFARGMVAGELEDGTLEVLLAQPIARWRVLLTEGVVLLSGIVTLVLASILGIFVFGSAFGIEVSYSGFLAFLPVGCALFIAIAGYSVLFSVIIRHPRAAVMASAGLTLFFYLLNFAGSYSKVMEKIDLVGIFHYYEPMKVLDSGTVPVKNVLVLLAYGAVLFALAVALFRRKDIN